MIHITDKNLQWEKWENQSLQDKAALKNSWAQLVRSNCCSLAGSLRFLAPLAAPWVYYFTHSLLYPQQEGCVIIWSFLDCFIPTEREGMDVFCMLYCYILFVLICSHWYNYLKTMYYFYVPYYLSHQTETKFTNLLKINCILP